MRFDAFGDDRHAHFAGESDGCFDDCHVSPHRFEMAYETLVNLDPIGGKPAQIVEGGKAGTEVVDGKLDTARAKPR